MEFRAMVVWAGLVFGTALPVGLAWAGDGFVLSITAVNDPIEKVMADVERAHALGATHFNIQVGLCQNDAKSADVDWCDPDGTEGRAGFVAIEAGAYRHRVVRLALELKRRGFTTGLLPMLLARDTSGDGQWRGFFEPTDFAAWSASYQARLDEMADVALAGGVTDLIEATELVRIFVATNPEAQPQRTAFWRAAYRRIRAKVGPKISVLLVANWDQAETLPFWDASDAIGVSAYFPLVASAAADTSTEALVAGWKPWAERLRAVSARAGRPLYFSEIGYASESNAAREPWGWVGPLDLELQRRLFDAFAKTWAGQPQSILLRFLVWALDVPSVPAADEGFDVIGKPAASALEQAFHRRSE